MRCGLYAPWWMWATAARVLGISSTTAYHLVREGMFPCRVLKIGGLLKVPTTGLWALLDLRDDTNGPNQPPQLPLPDERER